MGSADLRKRLGVPAKDHCTYGVAIITPMQKADGSVDMGGYNFRIWTLSKQAPIDSAKGFIAQVLNRYGYLEGENNLLFVSLSSTYKVRNWNILLVRITRRLRKRCIQRVISNQIRN